MLRWLSSLSLSRGPLRYCQSSLFAWKPPSWRCSRQKISVKKVHHHLSQPRLMIPLSLPSRPPPSSPQHDCRNPSPSPLIRAHLSARTYAPLFKSHLPMLVQPKRMCSQTRKVYLRANHKKKILDALESGDKNSFAKAIDDVHKYDKSALFYFRRDSSAMRWVAQRMRSENIKLNLGDYSALLITSTSLAESQKVFQEMLDQGIKPRSEACTQLLRRYSVEHRYREGAKLGKAFLQTVAEPLPQLYDLVLHVCMYAGDTEGAEEIRRTMKSKGIECSDRAYDSIVSGYCQANDPDAAEGILNEMMVRGYSLTSVQLCKVLRCFFHNHRVRDALNVYETYAVPNGVVHSSVQRQMMMGLVSSSSVDQLDRYVHSILSSGLARHINPFLPVLDFYAKMSRADEAEALLVQLRDAGLAPSQRMYCTVMGMWIDRQRLDRAYEVAVMMLKELSTVSPTHIKPLIEALIFQYEGDLLIDLLLVMKERDTTFPSSCTPLIEQHLPNHSIQALAIIEGLQGKRVRRELDSLMMMVSQDSLESAHYYVMQQAKQRKKILPSRLLFLINKWAETSLNKRRIQELLYLLHSNDQSDEAVVVRLRALSLLGRMSEAVELHRTHITLPSVTMLYLAEGWHRLGDQYRCEDTLRRFEGLYAYSTSAMLHSGVSMWSAQGHADHAAALVRQASSSKLVIRTHTLRVIVKEFVSRGEYSSAHTLLKGMSDPAKYRAVWELLASSAHSAQEHDIERESLEVLSQMPESTER